MDFIDAPVVIGDPDGRAVYLNPSFERCFGVSREVATGRSLASLFGGGTREAILCAVAEVCAGGETVRFQLRENQVGYNALASPIVAEQGRVGVVMLLTVEPAGDRAVPTYHRDIQDPLDDLSRVLGELAEQTGVRRDARCGEVLEDGIRAVGELRKLSDRLVSRNR